jgi:hypothetical protein
MAAMVTAAWVAWAAWAGWICNATRYLSFGRSYEQRGTQPVPLRNLPSGCRLAAAPVQQKTPLTRGFLFLRCAVVVCCAEPSPTSLRARSSSAETIQTDLEPTTGRCEPRQRRSNLVAHATRDPLTTHRASYASVTSSAPSFSTSVTTLSPALSHTRLSGG